MRTDTTTAQPAKLFPLRLCEVLEKEFVTTHGPLAATPDWLLKDADVNFSRLADCFASPHQCANSRAVAAVREKLVPALPSSDDSKWTPAFEQQLLLKLNELILSGDALYDHALLDRDNPACRLGELDAARSDADTSDPSLSSRDERAQLNRVLLEAALPPDAIVRVDTARLTALYQNIQHLDTRGPDGLRSALCLSGGGIRSASFGLGVITALARRGVLEKFDFLSTVSGGGYVGSWLSTWVHRHPHGLAGVVRELGTRVRTETTKSLTAKTDPAPETIRFLRDYSHFLNAKSGLFTADTWSWVGIYLRNLALNWLVIIPFLVLVMSAPRLYMALAHSWRAKYGALLYGEGSLFPWIVWITGFAVLLALVCINVHRPSVTDPANPNAHPPAGSLRRRIFRARQKLSRQMWILLLGVVPVFVFSISLTLLEWGLPHDKSSLTWQQIAILLTALPLPDAIAMMGRIGFDHLLAWGEVIIVVAWLISILLLPKRGWGKRSNELLAMLFAGFLTWTIISGLAAYASEVGSQTQPAFKLWSFTAYPAHVYAVLAVPTIIGASLAGMTLFIGAVSKFQWIEDEDREWWARFGAWILIGMVGWIVLSAIAVFGPPLLLEFPHLVTALGGVSGLIAVLLGKSSLTAATGQKEAGAGRRKRPASKLGLFILPAASALFIVAFLSFIALLTSAALDAFFAWISTGSGMQDTPILEFVRKLFPADLAPIRSACGMDDTLPGGVGVFGDPNLHLEIVCQTRLRIVMTLMAALALFIFVASSIVNLNKFSLHAVYRMRIVRTFLGASRGSDRRPNPFTGFDPLDDMQMHELQPGLLREGDIWDIADFVARLRGAMDTGAAVATTKDPAQFLAQLMCSRAYDPSSVLTTRLRNAKPEIPVLRALQQDILETMNRVLESVRLDRVAAFAGTIGDTKNKGAMSAAEHYFRHGNMIFGNRKLIEAAFPHDIRKYEFPPPPPHKLMHVINLTLNLVHGSKLAWQERKAAPFIVTPMHSGTYYLGFRDSRDYGGDNGVSIGTAVAVSGAAVSPNMGYSSSALTALLLTLFNVRLGWWLGNPGISGAGTYRLSEPRLLLRPLWAEAFGLTDDQSPYVYLSDGGHFENMGLFEMVLRRCRFIVVSDAGADPDYEFEDLGNAVRKIRIDLGVPIEFESLPIRRRTGPDDAGGCYCAIGRIRYSAVDGESASDGLLILFKPVLRGIESRDVQNYAAKNPEFPQEATSNQFYGESQFESYRQLGETAVESVFGDATDKSGKSWIEDIVAATRKHVGHNGGDAYWIDEWLFGLK
ncbi:MAG TPA: patatin-like phospholipase family protein [Burkholderiales bacterium]|nr:patatin-like phospholipase family protein [Burkholderiales bacterium]